MITRLTEKIRELQAPSFFIAISEIIPIGVAIFLMKFNIDNYNH